MEEKLQQIRNVLKKGWSKETTYSTELYEGADPYRSDGQCYITARTLHHIFGWDVVCLINSSYNHYWNRTHDGIEVDFTSDQMGGDGIHPISEIYGKGHLRTFKPINECKSINPRLKKYIKAVGSDLLAFLPSINAGVSSEVF